ncbi:MAG: TMEM175 family protein [Alphaproteobacteria bacterium]|nr:TMEM175 family protein [Alphaproteobacteria bacterium]
MADKLQGEANFTWRGADVSRLENLSDIVFALVITLAAAQSVPTSFSELTGLWREAISLAPCFALLLVIWRMHHVFFRRYDLQDGVTLCLNAVLLFLILVYIYPLKFMADFVVDFFTGAFSSDAAVDAVLSFAQVKWLYVIYGGFFAALYGVFALLYAHALRRADDIGLNARERAYTRFEVEQGIGVGVLSACIIVLAFILPAELSPFVGALFALMGINAYVCGVRAEARAKAAEGAAA